ESRIIRLGYGPDEIYTRSAQRSQKLWRDFFQQTSTAHLFRQTGVLWLAHESDNYCEATLSTLEKSGANCERLTRDDLSNRYPQLDLGSVYWGILEPDAGILMARQAVQSVCTAAQAEGVTYVQQAVISPQSTKRLDSLSTTSGESINAAKFV